MISEKALEKILEVLAVTDGGVIKCKAIGELILHIKDCDENDINEIVRVLTNIL